MEEQHKPAHQTRMDLFIDPKTMMLNNWYVIKRWFRLLKFREQDDVIRLFDVYMKAKDMKFADIVIKIRDGRVVNDPLAPYAEIIDKRRAA